MIYLSMSHVRLAGHIDTTREVTESLINPYGEDGDNYEMNWLINKYLQVAFLIVDEMHIAC